MIETGIFGGSFNPVHKGHISLAERILTEAQLNEVWFVVSPLNPFKCKAGDLLDDDKRLEMTRLALKDHPGLMASDYEFQLPRPSSSRPIFRFWSIQDVGIRLILHPCQRVSVTSTCPSTT